MTANTSFQGQSRSPIYREHWTMKGGEAGSGDETIAEEKVVAFRGR